MKADKILNKSWFKWMLIHAVLVINIQAIKAYTATSIRATNDALPNHIEKVKINFANENTNGPGYKVLTQDGQVIMNRDSIINLKTNSGRIHSKILSKIKQAKKGDPIECTAELSGIRRYFPTMNPNILHINCE